MPFLTVISELQSERRKHEKGTIENLLYKEMGNSLYGSVTKGINHKVKFDIKTNKTVRMEASDISNPILASFITAYVRSLLGELLQKVQDLGGKAVSVTTDGFITDLANLESRVLKPLSEVSKSINPSDEIELNDMSVLGSAPDIGADPEVERLTGFDEEGNIIQQDLLDGGKLGNARVVSPMKPSTKDSEKQSDKPTDALSLLKEYRKMRKILSGNASSLELKHEGCGLMSWTTRGQLSVNMGLKAITGLQTRDLDLSETWGLMSVSGLGKTVSFVSTSLRSAITVYKKGGHVTMDYSDRDFRIMYNNNRVVVENGLEDALLSTKPVKSIEESLTQRVYSRLTRGSLYQKYTSLKSINNYKSNLEIGIRAFLKDVLNGRNSVNMSLFAGYKGLLDFVHKYVYDSGEKLKRSLDSSYVSQIKMRSKDRMSKPRMVPRLSSIMNFFDYVKDRFPDYDTSLILSKS